MYGKPFKHNQDYGTCHGSSAFAFEQNGQLYNVHKQPVDQNGNVMPYAPSTAPAAPPAEPPPAAPVPAKAATAAEDDDTPEDEKPIDLLAWAQGHPDLKALPWQTVRLESQKILKDISELKSKAALKAAILEFYGVTETPEA